MDSSIVVGIVAGAAAHLVDENPGVCFDTDARANAVAIGFCAFRFYADPMIWSTDLIDEQARRGVHVADHRGKLAVVPEIADGQTTGGTSHGDAGPGAGGNIFELSIP